MKAYKLTTPVGYASPPKDSHVYVALNPDVATLMRASELQESFVFFKREYASDPFSDFHNLIGDDEFNFARSLLYETKDGRTIPVTRRAVAEFLFSKDIFDTDGLEEMVWEGRDFSKKKERAAITYFESQNVPSNMKLSASEIRGLLSMSPPGSPAQWPWSKLRAYGINDFGEELQNLARLYSKVEETVEKIRKRSYNESVLKFNGREIDLSEIVLLRNLIHPFGNYLRTKVIGKSEAEAADNKILTLEQDGFPEILKPIYSDLWQLMDDAFIVETITGTLINIYAYAKLKLNPVALSSATILALSDLVIPNPYTKEKYGDAKKSSNDLELKLASEAILKDLEEGTVDGYFSANTGYIAGLITTFNYIMLYLPEDFLEARNEMAGFCSSKIRNPFIKTKGQDKKARRIKQLGKKFEEEFSLKPRNLRYFFSSQYLDMRRKNEHINEAEARAICQRAKLDFIAEEQFTAALERYKIRVPKNVAEALLADA